MSSRTAVRGIGFTLTLLLVSSAQAVNYEAHRHDVILANGNVYDNVILTTRDFLEQLSFVTPKESYTLQEATEHLLQFGALLRARILDTFGSLLYVYYDDFSIAEVEALRKVYREILERRYDVFDLVPGVLRNQDTRPSRICAEIYEHATESCLRSSASVCRRIRKQHDLPHPDDHDTPALNVTYRIYRSSKISKQYPGGFSLATTLRFLQREVLTITPNLLSGLLCNVRYENYDDDIRLAEKELVRHFHEITETEIPMPAKELRKFHTVNSFLKSYIDTYAEKSLDNYLKKRASLISRRITDDVGTIDENIHLLGNVYENGTIHVGYLFDLVLPDDLLEHDVIEAKKYLVTKLNRFNVVEKYLRVQKYQQVTPAQLTMEITGQLRDIDFAKSIATSLRMHARFWRGSYMIESLDDLLELFDTYENLRQVPRYLRMMRKIDGIKKSLRDMKDVPVEILCNAPRACLRIGLQLVLRCRFISSQIKDAIKDFLELSDVCIYPVNTVIQESRRSVEIPFKISKVRYSTALQTRSTFIRKATTPRGIEERTKTTERVELRVPTEPWEESTEFTSTITPMTTTEPVKPISTTHQEETTTAVTSTTAATTTTPSATTITTSPTTTTTLPTTTLSTTTTTLPTTITTLPTTTTTLPTTTTTLPATTTTLLTTTTLPTTTTTMLPTTTTTTVSPTTTSTALPTTTTTTSPTTTSTTMPMTTTMTTTTSPIVTTERPIFDVKMKLKRSKVRTVTIPYDRVTKPLENVTVFITTPTPPTTPCESNECRPTSKRVETTTALLSTTQSPTTTPTMQTSTPEIIRETSSGPPTIYRDFFSEPTVSSTTELSETPVTKGDDCPKTCLEGCGPKSESFEPPSRRISCETSCDSVTEDCEDSTSPECRMESGNCECPPKEEKSIECMTLCPPESLSCEEAQGGCITSVVPTVDMKLERTRTRSMCEIRDPHHRRQLKRLAKMRAISAASASVGTSRLDVLRPPTSRHRDRIATKKLYNLLATKLPYSKDRKMAEYLLKRPHDGRLSGNEKDRRRRKQRKQVYRQARKFSGKLIRGTTMHHARGVTSLRHSQIKRISGGDAKSISA